MSFPVHHHPPAGIDSVAGTEVTGSSSKSSSGVRYEVQTLRIQRRFVDELINLLHALFMSLKALIIFAFHSPHRVWHAFSLEN